MSAPQSKLTVEIDTLEKLLNFLIQAYTCPHIANHARTILAILALPVQFRHLSRHISKSRLMPHETGADTRVLKPLVIKTTCPHKCNS